MLCYRYKRQLPGINSPPSSPPDGGRAISLMCSSSVGLCLSALKVHTRGHTLTHRSPMVNMSRGYHGDDRMLYEECHPSVCVFVCAAGNFPMIADDLVNSYHLLLCCLDLVFSNASLCSHRANLINPAFTGRWGCVCRCVCVCVCVYGRRPTT